MTTARPIDTQQSPKTSRHRAVPRDRARRPGVLLEAMPGLEWSHAVQPAGRDRVAAAPVGLRRAWVHRAPEEQVLRLYRAARAADSRLVAPWWLRALDAGTLTSRTGGFAVEDAIAALLAERPGWVYVPWVGVGEDGYWEYLPSERHGSGPLTTPTAITLTDRHPGWIDVLLAHTGSPATAVSVTGSAELAARLREFEDA